MDFLAGGAYRLLIRWIVADMAVPAEQMGRLLYGFTRSCEDSR